MSTEMTYRGTVQYLLFGGFGLFSCHGDVEFAYYTKTYLQTYLHLYNSLGDPH